MQIGVPKEILVNETRVAATPKTVEQLLKMGFSVAVEQNAGIHASFDNAAFEAAGATIVSTEEVWQSDLILKINDTVTENIESSQKAVSRYRHDMSLTLLVRRGSYGYSVTLPF